MYIPSNLYLRDPSVEKKLVESNHSFDNNQSRASLCPLILKVLDIIDNMGLTSMLTP
jgi:hypothetical protein